MSPSPSMDRRSVLRLGSALGLGMPQLLALEDPPAPAQANTWLDGMSLFGER